MAGRFDFHSPGAAFVDQMAKVLAERKAEERQKLLDSLTIAADQRAADEQRNMQSYREQQMLLQKAQDARDAEATERQRLGVVEAALDPSMDLSGMSPENLALLRKYGRLTEGAPIGTPQVSDSMEFRTEGGEQLPTEPGTNVDLPPVPPASGPRSTRYVGTPEWREKERVRREKGDLISGLLQNPKTAPIGQIMAMAAAAEQPLPLDALAQETLPGKPAYIFDESTGTMKEGPTVPRGSTIIQRSRPPATYMYPPEDPLVGQTLEGLNIYKSRTTGKEYTGTVPRAGSAEDGPLGIPTRTFSEHKDAVYAADASMGKSWSGRPADADIAALQYSALMIIESAKQTTPKIRELAREYALAPVQAAYKIAEMDLNDDELRQLSRLMQIAMPKRFIEFIKPPKQAKGK